MPRTVDGGYELVLCSACGARSTLPDRCTNCGHREYAPPTAPTDAALDARFARFGPAGTPVRVPRLRPGPIFRSLRGPAIALYVLLGVTAVACLLAAIAFFHRASLVDQLLRSKWSAPDADGANHSIAVWWGLATLAMVASAVVFVVWFHRARRNVELFPPSVQRLSGGWAIGGWFCPVVNLWFPPLIAHDIWKASDPRAPMRGGATPGRHPLLWAWWSTYLAANVVLAVGLTGRESDGGDAMTGSDAWVAYHESYRTADTAAGWAFLLMIIAAGTAIAVVARITGFQIEREYAFLVPPTMHPAHPMHPMHTLYAAQPTHPEVAPSGPVPGSTQPAAPPIPRQPPPPPRPKDPPAPL
ncbi:hypothetical protein B4N89_32860 [Embleya scabrispora]|uniref:DUF4328 domain-containing protein n=1 Tax=Embleya scabrispora TaxID=159449 RepID=A0A1T3NQE6_9ACTN|nr:DUF4328 domain-containing protein [Embleya scabrispora]OPC78912.1 hypothetical protein B4N89_32860 [Embleya scabrispora]